MKSLIRREIIHLSSNDLKRKIITADLLPCVLAFHCLALSPVTRTAIVGVFVWMGVSVRILPAERAKRKYIPHCVP